MSILIRSWEINPILVRSQLKNFLAISFSSETTTSNIEDPEEFRVLELIPDRGNQRKRIERKKWPALPPRAQEMSINQDWPSVWPTQRTYHPNVVPLPLRQGYSLRKKPTPHRFGNAELMKIPNFLHLTPPAIRRHCEALKKFCTQWPENLQTEEDMIKHFPLQLSSSDYCYSSPTIREPLARIVTLKVKLKSLTLDDHAKDKLLRLVGDRYNPETDYITLTADKCPLKKQNTDYVYYLLTALYNESWRTEPWEAEKTLDDMEYYDWEKNQSKTTLITLHVWPEIPTDTNYDQIPHATEYKVAVEELLNNGEDRSSINKYKEAVKTLLNIKSDVDVDKVDE